MPPFQRCCSFAIAGLADQKVQAIAPHAWTNGMRVKRRPSDRPRSPFSLGADITVVLISDTALWDELRGQYTRVTNRPRGASRLHGKLLKLGIDFRCQCLAQMVQPLHSCDRPEGAPPPRERYSGGRERLMARRARSGLENRQSEVHIRRDGDNCAMQLRRRVQTH